MCVCIFKSDFFYPKKSQFSHTYITKARIFSLTYIKERCRHYFTPTHLIKLYKANYTPLSQIWLIWYVWKERTENYFAKLDAIQKRVLIDDLSLSSLLDCLAHRRNVSNIFLLSWHLF